MKLAWGAHVSPEFRSKVVKIAAKLGCDPSHLMAVMAFETGGTFNPAIKNAAGSGATGLIQFMPSTAIGMGTTVEELAAKTAEDQLDDVFLYFAHYTGRLDELSDVYMAVLYPAAIGLFDSAVIFPPGSKAFLMNRGLDINHDGAVTKAEATAFVAKKLAEGMELGHRFDMTGAEESPPVVDTQPAAPIDERSETLPQPEKPTMPAIALSFLQPLLAGVLTMFSGRAQAAIGKATGADPESAGAFFNNLIGMVGAKVGVPVTDQTTAIEAVGKLTSMQDAQAKAAAAAEIESHALDYLDKIAPLLDKLQQSDRDRYQADQVSVDSARKSWTIPGVASLARELAANARLIFLVATIGVVGILVYQVFKSTDGKIDGMMYGLLTILVYAAARIAEAPYRSIFGQVSDSQSGTATAGVIVQANERVAKEK